MTSLRIVKDDENGGSYIPSSQRPDGTWRKPIRVRDGYVPQEEQPLYVSKGRLATEARSRYTVGGVTSSSNPGGGTLYDIGNYKPQTTIPGLNFVPEDSTTVTNKKKSKGKKSESDNSKVTAAKAKQTDSNNETAKVNLAAGSNNSATTGSDPKKRLRNLRKRLKDIENLEEKINSGELKTPEKEQLEKVKRRNEVLEEIEELEKLVEKLGLS